MCALEWKLIRQVCINVIINGMQEEMVLKFIIKFITKKEKHMFERTQNTKGNKETSHTMTLS